MESGEFMNALLTLLLYFVSGPTGWRRYVGSGTTGVFLTKTNPEPRAAKDTRANATCGIPTADVNRNSLADNPFPRAMQKPIEDHVTNNDVINLLHPVVDNSCTSRVRAGDSALLLGAHA